MLRRDFRPVPLKEAIATRKGLLPVAVTFDDGYADVLTEAVPVLERFEIPATVFVVPGVAAEGFWWDRLRTVFGNPDALPDRMRMEVGSTPLEWDREEGVDALRRSAYRALRSVDARSRGKHLDDLAEWAGVEPGSPVAVLDHDQLVRLAEHPLVEVGSHTMSHADLAVLGSAGLEHEIRGSRERLKDCLGQVVESFSYPHGGLQPAIRARIRAAGYLRACSSEGGLVHPGVDPFRLPRLWPPDWPGDRFRAWLRSWTGR
jgi:peptidoglycan/xylan/chitin deacetylase (PgdA/CDA1 family)